MESGKAISLETPVNQEKPKAYRSLLWPHLDELREWRSAQGFFKRAARREPGHFASILSFQAAGDPREVQSANHPDPAHNHRNHGDA